MKVKGKNYRAVWMEGSTVCMVEQNKLPFEFEIYYCKTIDDTCHAISTMITRGAGSIGAAGGYAMLQEILISDERYNKGFKSGRNIKRVCYCRGACCCR